VGLGWKRSERNKGKKRLRAKRAYFKLLRSCGIECELEEPIYLKRSE